MIRQGEHVISFGPFRLERANARLWRDRDPVALTPKALDVLHFLASRADRLVTKDELLSGVWPDVVVGDASIKVCVREIRKALGDEAKVPRYIETVHRRGYRFIAKVQDLPQAPAPAAIPVTSPPRIVGRETEIGRLGAMWETATRGRRQSVFITGGPGSGKTALVESLVQSLSDAPAPPIVLVGHCFEQYGAAEPYMPLWEALARAARERADAAAAFAPLLARHAAAYGSGDPVPPRAHAPPAAASDQPVASDRMLRGIADAIESLAADRPVLLLLEDVHWADRSTLDLLSALARRRGPARLMVLATYRPGEIADADHPLGEIVQELAGGSLCCRLSLGFLSEAAVAQYLDVRFGHGQFPRALASRLHQRTDGHPLFLVHVVDDLIEQGVLAETDGRWQLAGADGNEADGEGAAWLAVLDTQIPKTVRAMIELQRDRLAARPKLALEAAAIAGVEFSAAAVAGALGDGDVVGAEQVCEELSRGNAFLEPRGLAEWPDGTIATHFRFAHELYHAAVQETIPAARRVRLHRTLGERLESAWGERAPEEAANLAMHFEQGHDWPRAVRYLRHAADAATRQYAHREAVHYLRRATDASKRLPPAQRAEHELPLLMSLGVNLQVTKGCAAPEVLELYDRADALCRSSGLGDDVRATFPVLFGIWVFHKVRSDLRRADELAHRMLALAGAARDDGLLLQAHQAMCVTNLCLGHPGVTHEHMEQAAAVYDPARHADNTKVFGQDPGVASLAFGAVALWLLDRPGDAVAASDRALRFARRTNQPSTVCLALHFAAMLHQLRGDADMTEWITREAIAVSTQEGFSFWLAGARILRGWATAARGAHDEGVADIRAGLDAWLATGSRTYHSYYLGLLGDALLGAGRAYEAQAVLDEALAVAREMGEGLYEAEILRLRAHAARATDPASPEVATRLAESTAVARRQGASAFERRGVAALDALEKTIRM